MRLRSRRDWEAGSSPAAAASDEPRRGWSGSWKAAALGLPSPRRGASGSEETRHWLAGKPGRQRGQGRAATPSSPSRSHYLLPQALPDPSSSAPNAQVSPAAPGPGGLPQSQSKFKGCRAPRLRRRAAPAQDQPPCPARRARPVQTHPRSHTELTLGPLLRHSQCTPRTADLGARVPFPMSRSKTVS